MTFPLAALAVLATLGGFLGLPRVLGGGAWFQEWVSSALSGNAHAPAHGEAAASSAGFQLALMAVSVGLALAGLLLARRWYGRPEPLPEVPATRVPGLWRVLRQKYYFDEFYFLFISSPLRNASKWLYRVFDVAGIDGVVHGTGETTLWAAGQTGGLQRGHVGGYALALAAGAILVLLWLLL